MEKSSNPKILRPIESKYLLLGLLLFFNACAPSTKGVPEKQSSFSPTQYPNVLNYRGAPQEPTDRSAYAFFDRGAWFGYGLPDLDSLLYPGSFTGPYLLTQDNGVWIAPILSQLDLRYGEEQEKWDWGEAKVISSQAFPGRLEQIIELPDLGLRLQSDLVFATAHTSVTRVRIEKIRAGVEDLHLRWSGHSFLPGVSFSENKNQVQIHFGKKNHLGFLSTGNTAATPQVTKDQYQFQIAVQDLAKGESWETYLYHHFYFNPKEQAAEAEKLKQIQQNPQKVFTKNHQHWSQKIQKVLDRPAPLLQDTAHQKVAIKCLQTLTNNWRSPAGFLLHQGLFPSYNYEWFNGFWSWDSWKHAVALVAFDEALAKDQIRAMYDFQDSTGMIADCVYRDTIIENHNWRDTKPPLSAWAIWKVFEKTADLDFLQELFPKLEKYHRWWYQYRDHDQNGLCEYGSTDGSLIAAKWESGMDNAIRFDEAKILQNGAGAWSLDQESVDLNAYLFAEKKYLVKICTALNLAAKANAYQEEATVLQSQIQDRFFDAESGWFYDYHLQQKRLIKSQGPEAWIALWAGAASPEQAASVSKTLLDSSKFATFVPFPTVAADHPDIQAKNGYWRGPVWLDQAAFALQALRRYGYQAEADRLTLQLLNHLKGLKNSDQPIWENYHPHTGQGMESQHFSWSASSLLTLLLME